MHVLEAAQLGPKYITAIIDRQPTQITGVEPTDEGGWIGEAEVVEDRRIRRRRTCSRCMKSNSTPTENCWRVGELVVTCAPEVVTGAGCGADRNGDTNGDAPQ
jgi:hypothetical protein